MLHFIEKDIHSSSVWYGAPLMWNCNETFEVSSIFLFTQCPKTNASQNLRIIYSFWNGTIDKDMKNLDHIAKSWTTVGITMKNRPTSCISTSHNDEISKLIIFTAYLELLALKDITISTAVLKIVSGYEMVSIIANLKHKSGTSKIDRLIICAHAGRCRLPTVSRPGYLHAYVDIWLKIHNLK